MKNYFFSVSTHLILLLLLLGLSFTTIKNTPKEKYEQVIMVDFGSKDLPEAKADRPDEVAKKRKSSAPSPQKAKKMKTSSKKTDVKKTLRTSQKPNAESSKVLDEKSSIVKKIIPSIDPEQALMEKAEAERLKKKAEKRSEFSSLLSKAKEKTAAEDNRPENQEEVSGVKTGTSSSSSKNKNIQGVLGNRKVLRSPTIKDTSQKKGRVVVKICVGKDGKVESSKYTMMGSTTSDTYLIGLAEKGALQYLFSASSNPKECGNVVIDFQLR